MTVEQLRTKLYRLEKDEHLTPSEREYVRICTLGALINRPRTVGEAKRLCSAYESAIHQAVTEIPY